jgi:uncharacterized membrane protein
MSRIKSFVMRSLIGGGLVILPIAILVLFFRWVFHTVTDVIQPFTDLLTAYLNLPEVVGDALVIASIALVCFVVGTIVSTSAGKLMHQYFDKYFVRLAPGYRMVKEIVHQFFGGKGDSPFSKGIVARVKLFGPDIETSATAIVTSIHADGRYTVFVPTGPNPTSGMIYHVSAECVELHPEINIDSMLRTVIACGAGSAGLFGGALEAKRG